MRTLARTLAAAALFMIFAGAMVTTMKAGDSVPDWPLSYGQVLPPMKGLVLFEHGHRMVGWLVGLLCIALALTARSRGAWVLLALVLFQGGLGGLRVLLVQEVAPENQETWRAALAMLHAATAQGFFVMAAGVAFPPPSPSPQGGREYSRSGVVGRLAGWIVAIQVVLGIVARQTGWGVMVHALFGVLTVAVVSLFASRVGGADGRVLALLILAQAGLGLASLAYRIAGGEGPPELAEALVRSSHVALGALVLGMAVNLVPSPSPPPQGGRA